jgi:hypothetical protein
MSSNLPSTWPKLLNSVSYLKKPTFLNGGRLLLGATDVSRASRAPTRGGQFRQPGRAGCALAVNVPVAMEVHKRVVHCGYHL